MNTADISIRLSKITMSGIASLPDCWQTAGA
jgi:hypothetical protein